MLKLFHTRENFEVYVSSIKYKAQSTYNDHTSGCLVETLVYVMGFMLKQTFTAVLAAQLTANGSMLICSQSSDRIKYTFT